MHNSKKKKNGLKNIIMHKFEKSCNEGIESERHDWSFVEEQEKKKEICLYRLIYISVIWICAQLHVNGNGAEYSFSFAMETA